MPSAVTICASVSPRATSTQALRSFSSSTAGRESLGKCSSVILIMRVPRPARSAARANSAGVSPPASTGRPVTSACALIGCPNRRATCARQAASGSVSACAAGIGLLAFIARSRPIPASCSCAGPRQPRFVRAEAGRPRAALPVHRPAVAARPALRAAAAGACMVAGAAFTSTPTVSSSLPIAASTRNSSSVTAYGPVYSLLLAANNSFSALSTSSRVRCPMENCRR